MPQPNLFVYLQILRQMRKLPWGDGEVYQWAVTGLTQIWNVKYNNIHCMADLMAGLKSYQVPIFLAGEIIMMMLECIFLFSLILIENHNHM